MANNQLNFTIPVTQSFSALVTLLQNNFPVRVQAETVIDRTFFDTFDWRLYNYGAVIEIHEAGPHRRIYWRADKDDHLTIQPELKQVPRLASDLAECKLRQQLQSVISTRELTPRIKIKIKRTPLAVMDNNEKVVVRINLDESWYRPAETRAEIVLGKCMTISSVEGNVTEFSQLETFINAMELHPAQDNMMRLALAQSGINTAKYTKKLNLLLEPEMSSEKALKIILLRLLKIMQQNTAGSIKGEDTEFMHDYRVSIRKTRSALTQINHVLSETVIKKYKKFLSGLGKLTNPVRDFDVFLLQLDSYQQELKKPGEQQIQALREYLLDSRNKAQKKFVNKLQSSQYAENIKEWREFLKQPAPLKRQLENSGKAIEVLADELIWEIYQQVLDRGNTITTKTKPEELHELRKTCKKLRYLMDFFQSLYPRRKIRELIQVLKGLQDNLGEFNDLYVHAGILKEFVKQSSDEEANKACRQMITILKKNRGNTKNKFEKQYSSFSSLDNQKKFRELFLELDKALIY